MGFQHVVMSVWALPAAGTSPSALGGTAEDAMPALELMRAPSDLCPD